MLNELLVKACSVLYPMDQILFLACSVVLTIWSAFISAPIGLIPGDIL